MGDIADAMLDGTMCCQCGEYLGTGNGFATLCAGCKAEERRQPSVGRGSRYNIRAHPKIQQPADRRVTRDKMCCPFCVKKVKIVGFGQHMLDQHADKWKDER